MARIVVGSTMVRYPLGGMNQWVLGWLIGLKQLGHEVYFVEKSGWPNSCYDVSKKVMTDDCSYGVSVVNTLLLRYGLKDKWCFVDNAGRYHGLTKENIEAVFETADLFLDLEGNEWLVEAANTGMHVFVDGEPGWYQIKMENSIRAGYKLPFYDYYYTVGSNVGTDRSPVPTLGKTWRHIFPPIIVTDLPPQLMKVKADAPFTTVMNWKAHKQVEFDGVVYGQKDIEFHKFMNLPQLTSVPLEVSISGSGKIPKDLLIRSGWRLRNADDVAMSVDSYRDYIWASKGEFSVAKNVFIATNCGWFGERAGYYMANKRPAVVQDTGFSYHLPCGKGVFAVSTVEEAAAAIDEINANYERHAGWAREIAVEYLDAQKVLSRLLDEIGI